MEMFREGGSTSRPPMLEGANYPYWKTKMRAFLRVVDERVWMSIEGGWWKPTMMENEIVIPKPMSQWTTVEMERANFNSKALHALFNAVSTNELKVIANCEIAEEAWEKLKIKNEGTDAVKKSRLRALAKAFENLTMEEDESVAEFHAKLCDISNESYALGKTYSNSKLVRKVLSVLPRRFMSKVTSIEEIRNIEELDLDELIGSLQNYELSLSRWKKTKKQKEVVKENSDVGITLIHQEKKKPVLEDLNGITDETVALLTRNYAKFLKKNYRKNSPADKENLLRRNKGVNFKPRQASTDQKGRGIKCRECDGYGHIQAECGNTLKKKKALAATWSDSDEEKNSTASEGSDEEKQVLAFMAQSCNPVESEDDAVSTSLEADSTGRQHAYEEMFAQWEYMTKQIRALKNSLEQVETEKGKLEDTVKNLNRLLDEKENEIYKLTADLIRTKQALQFIPPGTAAINQTLQLQKPYGDRTSLGYKMLYKQGNDLSVEHSLPSNVNSSKKEDGLPDTSITINESDSSERRQVPTGPIKLKFEGRRTDADNLLQNDNFIRTCHFCNRRGHIRPKCYKLQNYLKAMINRPNSFPPPNKSHGRKPRREWKIKSKPNPDASLVAKLSLSAFVEGQWDGNKGQIAGRGDVNVNGAAQLTNVLYVRGLKANLISIGQLCDDNLSVSFTKTQCLVSSDGCVVLTGNRTVDQCYAICNTIVCNRTFLDKPDLWHYRLGHLNYRDLQRLVKLQAVRGIPDMKVSKERVCGPCQLGKQHKASHPTINRLLTSRVLELMHVDLMGPMQNESISGKRYVMVLVDDYSRFTWV
ncbi:uncharacterized protein LOC133038346 [Cannabis sativa]|uniref:uncharacterized protein LOC133038346 n=1 Tax=Cannabis sativa TaxID=3483 RepID=UPI0029C9DD1F|nr:uncharacterized protein LOC133038346 [Cannabis sativa]